MKKKNPRVLIAKTRPFTEKDFIGPDDLIDFEREFTLFDWYDKETGELVEKGTPVYPF